MDEWEVFVQKLTFSNTNTTRADLLQTPLAEQWEHELQSIAFEGSGHDYTSARLLITDGVIDHYYRQWSTLTKDVLYYENNLNLPVKPGERVGIAFFGLTSGDIQNVYLRGRRRKLP